MSRIDELIRELCPGGVEFRSLGTLEDLGYLKLGRGEVISKTDLASWPGEYPVYSSSAIGNGEFGRYGKYMFDDERITWSVDGGGKFFFRQAHRYSVTNVCGWLKVLKPEVLSTRYLFFVLSSLWMKRDYNYIVKAHPSVIRQDYVLPIPPIEIQKEIVSILDKFTQLEAELEAELEARRTQYEVTRDRLLDFSGDLSAHPMGEMIRELCPEGVPKAQISDHFLYEQPTKYLVNSTDYLDSGTPVLTAGQTFILGYTTEEDGIFPASTSNPVVIFDDFTTATKWVDFPFKAKSSAMKMITPKSSSATELRFLFYWMGNFGFVPGEHARHWISVYSKLEIPWPPPAVQREIVFILDKLDALVNDIAYGLPAEIEARRKQYEYYRNKLLTFKELDAA